VVQALHTIVGIITAHNTRHRLVTILQQTKRCILGLP